MKKRLSKLIEHSDTGLEIDSVIIGSDTARQEDSKILPENDSPQIQPESTTDRLI